MNGSRHVIVLNRWRARYAEYERYLDHEHQTVTYITTEVGVDSVPGKAAEVVIVGATDDVPAVREEVRRLADKYGAPAGIVALKEDDLLVAAELRAEWGCPGPTSEQLIPFRDKFIMASTVAAAGVAVPAFAVAPDRAAVVSFAEQHGWPVVIKPRVGSSSEGVVIAHSPGDVELPAHAMVQIFDPGRIYHVDGFFDGSTLGTWRASRYVHSCLDFRTGSTLGSVEEDDSATNARIGAFAERALRALSSEPVVFHLEIFVDGDRCAFLEIGARVGGAEIPFLWREVHGYDLMEAAFRIALGDRPAFAEESGSISEVGGWLLAPAPTERPCRILEITPMTGRTPGPYAEALLSPGDILPDAAAYYEHVGGRFRFRGPTSAAVEEAVVATARDFRVSAAALVPAESP
jgi:biotin carboxylase